jgi:hypothetical protein
MVQSSLGLIAPILRSHIRTSFLDIVFHLLLRTALYRLVNTPDAAQRWPIPVDACVCVCVCGYGSGPNNVLQRKGTSCERIASFSGPASGDVMIAVGLSDPCSTSPKSGLVVPVEAVLTAS